MSSISRHRPSPAILVALLALFLALAGTAAAAVIITSNSQVAPHTIAGANAAHGLNQNIIAGSVGTADLGGQAVTNATLATNSVTGRNLAPNSVTAAAISRGSFDLSFQGATLANGWTAGGFGTNPPGFSVDILGVMHLRGSLANGASDSVAFTLPPLFAPLADSYFPVYTFAGSEGSLLVRHNGQVVPFGANVKSFTSLEGVTWNVCGPGTTC